MKSTEDQKVSEAKVLGKLREICLRLPAASETITFGHPTFQVEKKTFAVLEEYRGELGIALKVEHSLQSVFLKDPRFFRTPYIGKQGWVTLRVPAAPLNWKEITELVKGSARLVAPKRNLPGRRGTHNT
jgi:predicted DNA-binding protein (MmcQ/YjbR family)